MSHSSALAPERTSRPIWQSPQPVPALSRLVAVDSQDRLMAADARTALREAAAAAEAAAHARSLAERLDEALAVLKAVENKSGPGTTVSSASRHGVDALSPREREVLALVAEGRSNKAIAAALFVSPNTVKTHVASLLHKLQAGSRVQLAAIATRQSLHHRAAIDPVSI